MQACLNEFSMTCVKIFKLPWCLSDVCPKIPGRGTSWSCIYFGHRQDDFYTSTFDLEDIASMQTPGEKVWKDVKVV